MYFLSDFSFASFAEKPTTEKPKPIDEKTGILKKGLGMVVGKTPMGTLTRAASVAGIGGSLYGMSKMRKTSFQDQAQQLRNAYNRSKLFEKIKNASTGNTAKNIAGSAVGTVAGGLVLNEGRKLYEKKNRKWWEVL